MFQLTGNKILENFLEYINIKMGLQSFIHCDEYAAIVSHNSTNDRLTTLENVTD